MSGPDLQDAPGPPNANLPRILLKYFTPHKVFLLVLIHAFCNSIVAKRHYAPIFRFLLEHIEVEFLSHSLC